MDRAKVEELLLTVTCKQLQVDDFFECIGIYSSNLHGARVERVHCRYENCTGISMHERIETSNVYHTSAYVRFQL